MTYLVVLTLLIAQAKEGTGRDSANDLATSVAGAYDENRSKFASGVIDFDYTKGDADTPREARAGTLKKSFTAPARLIFKGNDAMYSRVYSDADIRATTTQLPGNQMSGFLMSLRALTDGRSTILDRFLPGNDVMKPAHSVSVLLGSDEYRRYAKSPLSLGVPSASRSDLARDILSHGGAAEFVLDKVDGHVDFEGRDVVRIVLKGKYAKRTYYVDLNQGAVPARIFDEVDFDQTHLTIDTYHDDVRQVPGRGWLPFVTTIFNKAAGTERLKITSADFEKRVDLDAIRLDFEAPTGVVNQVEKRTYTPRKSWSLHKLPSASSPDSQPLPSQTGDVPMPGEREPSHWGRTGLLALGAVLVLAGVGFLFKVLKR